jgi:predicted DNA-binding transcriptional regulator YafY
MLMEKKMYVDAEEISRDWGVSKPTAYRMIRSLNDKLRSMNPNLIIISGKVNRQFYEECCTITTK